MGGSWLVNSGRFYPDSVRSAEVRLQHYASQFHIAEVGSTIAQQAMLLPLICWLTLSVELISSIITCR